MSVHRGDERQRERWSVCGQNKMYPVLKTCLNCQSGLDQWLGQFHFQLKYTTAAKTHFNQQMVFARLIVNPHL